MTRKTSVFLIASLCLNAALLGGVAAGFYTFKSQGSGYEGGDDHRKDRSGGPRGFDDRLARSAFDRMSPDDRTAFRAQLAEEWRQSRDERAKIRAARAELTARLSETEFSRAEAEAAFRTIREAELAMRARLHSRLLDLLERLDPAERIKMIEETEARAEAFEARRKTFQDARDKRRDERPPPPPENP